MKEKENKTPEAIWNLRELLARVDYDQELLHDLLAIFREDYPKHISSLDKAVAAGDLKSAAASAHSLKGMLANLAAARAATAAARLEQMARNGEKGALRECLEALGREINAFLQELAAHSPEVRT